MDQSKETKTAAQPQTNHSAANIVLQEVEIPQNTNRQSPVTPNAQVNGSSDKRQAKYKEKFSRVGERHPLWKDPSQKKLNGRNNKHSRKQKRRHKINGCK